MSTSTGTSTGAEGRQFMRPMSEAPMRNGAKVLLMLDDGAGGTVVVEAECVHGCWKPGETGGRINLPPQWVCPYDVWGGNTVTDDAIGWLPYPLTPPEPQETE